LRYKVSFWQVSYFGYTTDCNNLPRRTFKHWNVSAFFLKAIACHTSLFSHNDTICERYFITAI
jgi:hypothetical protein